MVFRCTNSKYVFASLAAFMLFTSSVNAGSFKDFILDEGIYGSSQASAKLPENSQSARCMQCHDGSQAKNISIKHADTAMTFSNHGSSNHPVGMVYDSYVRRNPASYITAAKLDSRVKLENGQVTCVSCHETKKHNSQLATVTVSTTENCGSTRI